MSHAWYYSTLRVGLRDPAASLRLRRGLQQFSEIASQLSYDSPTLTILFLSSHRNLPITGSEDLSPKACSSLQCRAMVSKMSGWFFASSAISGFAAR